VGTVTIQDNKQGKSSPLLLQKGVLLTL